MKKLLPYAVFAALWGGMMAMLAISVVAPDVLDRRGHIELAANVDGPEPYGDGSEASRIAELRPGS